eukprot:1160582_1
MNPISDNFKHWFDTFVDIMSTHDELHSLQTLLLTWFTNKNINSYLNAQIIADTATLLSDIDNTELEVDDIHDSIHLSELILDASQPSSILNIPTDVSLHINHYLCANDLTELQKTCRYFRLMSRHPLSLYSLRFRTAGHFTAYTYDHIQHLIMDETYVNKAIVANSNWNNTVHEVTYNSHSSLWGLQWPSDDKGTILGGQMTVDNISKLNILDATSDMSFYKFILRSFKHVEQLQVMMRMNNANTTCVDLSGINACDIHIFKHLKKVHVHRGARHTSMMPFAKGLADLNNRFFQRPIEFVMSMDMRLDDTTKLQTIIEHTFATYAQFNKIYLKISFHTRTAHLLHQTITNLLKYLSLKQDQFCVQFVSITAILNGLLTVDDPDTPVDSSEFMGAQLLSKAKPTEKAMNIIICMENECYSGYLCSASDITLTNEYNTWKILTETIADEDALIKEYDRVKAFCATTDSWVQTCTSGKVMIHFNPRLGKATVRVIDEGDSKTKLLQYIDGTVHAKCGSNTVTWSGRDYTHDNISGITSQFRLRFLDNSKAKDFAFFFNQYTGGSDDELGFGKIIYRPHRRPTVGNDNVHNDGSESQESIAWTSDSSSGDDDKDNSDDDDDSVWALEQGFSGSSDVDNTQNANDAAVDANNG